MERGDLEAFRKALLECFKRRTVEGRTWLDYHDPKNLAMSLVSEAAELMQHFRWTLPGEPWKPTEGSLEDVKDEMGDVLLNLVALADELGVDLLETAWNKLAKIKLRFPESQ